jgi:hypothetical protein
MSEKKSCAYYKAEERYAKLTITFFDDQKLAEIENVVNAIVENNKDFSPEIYISSFNDGARGYNLEINDDYDKTAGDYFDKIMIELGITECE